MKNLFQLLSIFLIMLYSINIFAEYNILKLFEGFDSKPISYDLTGIASSGSTILLWGNVGEIMRSTDMGNSWHRVRVSERIIDFVVGIEYLKNKYVGVLSNGSGIVSFDDGKTWQIVKLNETNRIFKLLNHQDKIFYMTDKEFKIYDDNFQLIKTIPFQTDTNQYECVISNNRIIYPIGKGKIGMIDLTNEQKYILYLDSLNICQDCPIPTDFFADNDYFYFLLQGWFYRYSFQTGKINSFAKPSTTKNTSFILNNGSLYQIFSKKLEQSDSLYFYQLISGATGGIRINNTGFDRRVINSVFKSVRFLNNNTVIGIGANKLICKSSDGGKSWKVLSFFNPMPPLKNGNLFIFDTMNIRYIDDFFNYYFTTNGGVTWLSTQKFSEGFFSAFSPGFERFHYFFNPDTAISVVSKEFTHLKNICFTHNRGESLSVMSDPNFVYLYDEYWTLPFNEKLLVFTNNGLVNYGTWFIVWSFYKDLKITKDTFRLYRKLYNPFLIDGNIVAFSVANPPKELLKNKSFWIIKSPDGGITWDSIPILQNYWFLPDTVFCSLVNGWKVKNIIYYWLNFFALKGSSYDILYQFDAATNSLILIDSTTELFQPQCMFELKDKFYLNLLKPIFKEGIISILERLYVFDSPTSFQIVDLNNDRIRPRYFVRSLVNPSLFAMSFWDTLSKSGFILLMNEKEVKKVEEQTSLRKLVEFSLPYPQPASVRVRARVVWDGSFDLREAIDGVYDSMGRKVEGKERIRLDARSRTSGELEWECSGVPAGVYFILIRWQGGSETVPVVVE